jgi:hypothetical protein
MQSDPPRAIGLHDLARLTLRANVAYAVRCAQRVRPCFALPADAPRRRAQMAAVDGAIRVAAAFCRGLPVEAGRAAAAVQLAAVVAEETCPFTNFAGYAALYAARAAACAEEAVRNPAGANITEVVAAAFGAGRVLTANADAFALELVVAALHADMEHLRNLPRDANEIVGRPLDPSESGPLGPLWPAGMPGCFAPEGRMENEEQEEE